MTYTYEIRVQGHLDARWLYEFQEVSVARHPEGETVIRGALDQAALHGVLNRIRDLGLVLLSVGRCPHHH